MLPLLSKTSWATLHQTDYRSRASLSATEYEYHDS